jgi:DNA-binding SARP family transcriptional activator/tetratricopeptide (TPR) repeat protein
MLLHPIFHEGEVMDASIDTGNSPAAFPQLRIWLCGPFRMVWVDPTSGAELPPSDASTGGRDWAAAIFLLALLLRQPNRQAHRDWVMEQFWPESSRSVAVHRLENIFSALRKLLRPSSGGESLLHSISGKKSSGPSYCLEAYPKLWVDTDAVTWNVEQACRMERFGDDALPFWERAFALLKRGPFLVDDPYEPYAAWVTEQRSQLEGYTRQCVHALARLYLARHGEAGKAEAMLLLRTYWQQHKTDEDALRPLLELLGEQERYQEAEEYYQQLVVALAELEPDEEGQPRAPDARTHDIREYLLTKQIQRKRSEDPHSSDPPLSVRTKAQEVQTRKELLLPLSGVYSEQDKLRLGSPLVSQAIAQGIIEVIQQLGGLDYDMHHPSRRETLAALLSLVGATAFPLEWWEHLAHAHPSAMKDDEFNYFQQIIEGGWGFLNVGEWNTAELVLESLLPDTMRNASRQRESALLAARGLLLRSLIEAHRMNLATMVPLCKQAVAYARYAGDHTTLCATLNGLAVAFKYNQQQEEAFKTYLEALCYCDDQANPLIRSRVYAGVAAAFAGKGRKHEADLYMHLAYELFPIHPELDPHFLSADHGLYMLAYYQGIMYLVLNQPQEALKAFESYQEALPVIAVPQRNQLEITNHKGRAAILSNNLEIYAQCLQEGIEGALEIKSQKRLNELLGIFQEEIPETWRNDASITKIVEQYPFLVEAK